VEYFKVILFQFPKKLLYK